MRIGCTFPQDELGTDPAAIRDFAQAAEGLGYSHLMIYDHVLGAVHAGREPALSGPYTEENAFHEPFVTLGFLAAVTSRIELTTGIIILPQRQTVLAAKQAAEVANLAKGRFRLGLGSGWNYVEYEGLGVDWRTRARRYEEQLVLLRELWTKPVVDFTGDFHRVDRAGIKPLPEHPIQIWLGGGNDAALRRAARHADGFLFSAGGPRTMQQAEQVRAYVAEQGRDPKAFGIEAILEYAAGPDRWVQHVDSWRNAGATHVCMRSLRIGIDGVQAQIDAITRYAEAVGVKP